MITEYEEAENFFSEIYGGKHHIPGKKIKKFGDGWCINHYGDLSTFDYDYLSRFVFLSHDRCFRTEIMQSGPGMVKIAISKRTRTGTIMERHPTLNEAITEWRGNHPLERK